MSKKELYEEKTKLSKELYHLKKDYEDQSLKVQRQADHIEVLKRENERLNAKINGPQPVYQQ